MKILVTGANGQLGSDMVNQLLSRGHTVVATDIFGNVYYSDMATMKMKYTYDELLENPLPDRTPAAEITSIEPYIR